jgi:hypothetical protein
MALAAARSGNADELRRCLILGDRCGDAAADDGQTECGQTPAAVCMLASERGHAACLRVLHELGVDLSLPVAEDGLTPLQMAVMTTYPEATSSEGLRFLLSICRVRAGINKEYMGRRALRMACGLREYHKPPPKRMAVAQVEAVSLDRMEMLVNAGASVTRMPHVPEYSLPSELVFCPPVSRFLAIMRNQAPLHLAQKRLLLGFAMVQSASIPHSLSGDLHEAVSEQLESMLGSIARKILR